jgi:hypothetical protein
MDGGAFIPLKSGRTGRESTKQAEIRLANLLKILAIALGASKPAGRARHAEVVSAISNGYD